MASDREAALLRQILDHPDDLAARAVYADELQARGDPRGEMIAAELAGAGVHAAAVRRAHASTWWPELAGCAFATRNGFVHRIRSAPAALPALARLFSEEPVAELELDPGDPPARALALRVRRLAIRGELGLADRVVDRSTVERLELCVPGLRFADAITGEWPALRELRIVVEGTLASTWPSVILKAAAPNLVRLELVNQHPEPAALAALRAARPALAILTTIGDGPFTLDLPNGTIALHRAHDQHWRVDGDGGPTRVRWQRILGHTNATTYGWQIGDVAPLEQVAHALAINAARTTTATGCDLRLPAVPEPLPPQAPVYRVYADMFVVIETAQLVYDPDARELAVTFIEYHRRGEIADD